MNKNVLLISSREYHLIIRALLEAEKNHWKSSYRFRKLLDKITDRVIPPIEHKYPLYAFNFPEKSRVQKNKQ